jgi:hypothetical protein
LIGAIFIPYVIWRVNGRPHGKRRNDYVLAGLVLWALLALLGYLAHR